MLQQSLGLLRVGVMFCFKLLMGVPWHAFPPEALLVRRIIKGLLLQVSERHAASVNSVEGVSYRTPIDPTANWAMKWTLNEVTLEVSSSESCSTHLHRLNC